ncbi:DNA phosphorothioation-dependent restriction protein DptG [Saccharicrinis sp. 156]|uniref:DNA phosphorothioation-dependent restriction protein DptG n=1 Tax=Saccharicrinis sp. 156 TaxID=3417574 RepID=UPI003D32F550
MGLGNFNIEELKKNNQSGDSFKHTTGNKVKVLPFVTNNKNLNLSDISDFHGFIGDCIRKSNNLDLPTEYKKAEDYKVKIKDDFVTEACKKTSVENGQNDFEKIINEIFIDDEGRIVKFNLRSLLYANFSTNKPSTLLSISTFIYELFYNHNSIKELLQVSDIGNSNPLFDLAIDSLPKLEQADENSKLEYSIVKPEIIKLFKKDIEFLATDKTLLLNSIEEITKYYYFFYISQLALEFDRHFNDSDSITPLFYSLEWESISKSRKTNYQGWDFLSKKLDNLFSHACFFEFVNYIDFGDGKNISSYKELSKAINDIEQKDNSLLSAISELKDYYKNIVTQISDGSWEKCLDELSLNTEFNSIESEIVKEFYSFFYMINYQFNHDRGSRRSAFIKYSNWAKSFCTHSYIKNRGRLGGILTINQETLLLITRLCIGNNDKIRLKDYWLELEKRGICFDQTSKGIIIQLFEKINLIEKKSDSGDAQYVKSTI